MVRVRRGSGGRWEPPVIYLRKLSLEKTGDSKTIFLGAEVEHRGLNI